MAKSNDYGEQYLCIRLANGEDMYVYADQTDIVDGAIIFSNKNGRRNVILASGQWECCYVVSRADGVPVAIESLGLKGSVQYGKRAV
jgi:hypothetical protein